MSWQPGYDTLSVIHCENEGSIETSFLFLITCDRYGIRAELNNLCTKGTEIKLDTAGIALQLMATKPMTMGVIVRIRDYMFVSLSHRNGYTI